MPRINIYAARYKHHCNNTILFHIYPPFPLSILIESLHKKQIQIFHLFMFFIKSTIAPTKKKNRNIQPIFDSYDGFSETLTNSYVFFLRRTHKWANSTNFVETFFKGNNIFWVNPRINQFWAVLSFSKNELVGIWTLDRWLWKKSKNIPRTAQFFHTKFKKLPIDSMKIFKKTKNQR